MQNSEPDLTIEELSARTDVSVRTIRFYIVEGLIPGSAGRGKAALYGEEHVLRLKLIRRLVAQHLPLREVRERLAGLSLEDVRSLLAEETAHEETLRLAEGSPSPRYYVSELLRRSRASRPTPQGDERRAGSPSARSASPADRALPVAPPASAVFSSAGSGDAAVESAQKVRQAWHRFELAPGVELHIRSDVQDTHPDLVERVRSILGSTLSRLRK